MTRPQNVARGLRARSVARGRLRRVGDGLSRHSGRQVRLVVRRASKAIDGRPPAEFGSSRRPRRPLITSGGKLKTPASYRCPNASHRLQACSTRQTPATAASRQASSRSRTRRRAAADHGQDHGSDRRRRAGGDGGALAAGRGKRRPNRARIQARSCPMPCAVVSHAAAVARNETRPDSEQWLVLRE